MSAILTNPGYHLVAIDKGQLGELSDLVGAVEAYLAKHHPGTTLDDLKKMSDVTHRAFQSGRR